MRRVRAVGGWRVGVAVAAMLALTPACEPRRRPPADPEVIDTDAPAPAPKRRGELVAQAVARATSPLQLLPETTVAVGSIAGVKSLLAVIDLDAIVTKYRGQYDQLAQLIAANVGYNLLDPGQWREVGVDPDGAMGAAMVDMRSETFVGFFTLSDPDKFRRFLDKVGGGRLFQPVLEDRGLVLKSQPDSSSALVLRDGFAFFVTTDRPNAAPYDFARLLATIDPARGLTATPRYMRAIASPEPPRPLTAYIDVWAIVEAEQATWAARIPSGEEVSWAEQELARAVQRGAPEHEQAPLRQAVDEQRTWQRQADERRAREYAMLTRWLGALEPIVFEFTGSKTGVVGKIRAKLPESAPLRGVLRNAAAPSPMFAALGERAVVMFGASLEVAAAIAGFEEAVRADGDDPAKIYQKLADATAVDFKRDVAPLLAGSGGFALTVSDALLRGDPHDDSRDVGFAAAFAVKDGPAAQALLDRLVRKVPAPLSRDGKTGAHVLAMPGYRKVYAGLVAGQIVVTTDDGVLRRMASGSEAPLRGVDAAVVPVLTARDATMQGLLDVVLPGFLVFAGRSHDTEVSAPMEPYGMFPDVKPEALDRVPRSRAYKAKLREWTAIQSKIRKEEQAQAKRRVKTVLALASSVGLLAANLREQPDGLELVGGQFFGKRGLTEAIELGVDYFADTRGNDRSWELYGQRSALEEELRKIRLNDLSMALHVPVPLQ